MVMQSESSMTRHKVNKIGEGIYREWDHGRLMEGDQAEFNGGSSGFAVPSAEEV